MLLEGERRIPLGSRAFAILKVLLDRAGESVNKEELIAAAWPGTFVGESNLRVHIAGIRRALGDGREGKRYIVTVPGRGYCFIASIERAVASTGASHPPAPAAEGNLPLPLTRIIGRTPLVATLSAQLARHRFITLVGPAGIGKTTVALAVAREVAPTYANGAYFVDLAPVTDPGLVPSALAASLGLPISSANEIASLIAFLEDRHVLLVLDNCEHVIEIAAEITECIHRRAPRTHILATSRERLRGEGERVYRVPPLETPLDSERLGAAQIMSYSGVELFIDRASASMGGFELSDADASIVADICRRLDGIALAIELAASRVEGFGVRELAARLDHHLGLLTNGRRTATPRHRKLAAALDWSYRLLSPAESATLRRLSVFMGSFDLDGATAVTGNERSALTVDSLANLIDKSLVAANLSGVTPRYRLLISTRLYAFERLTESGELEATRRRHAHYHRDLFARARSEWETAPTIKWLAAYGDRLDDLRAALDWAFSPEGDVALGLALTVDAVPLWLQLSLMRECVQRIEAAFSHVGSPTNDNARLRLRLSTARNLARMYTSDAVAEAVIDWTETLALAEQLGDRDYQLRGIWGQFADSFNRGEIRALLDFARRFGEIARDPADRLIGDRLIGTALHLLGDQDGARTYIERMLKSYTRPPHSSHIIRYQNDQIVTARRVLVPLLWLQGYPDQATRMAEEAVVEAVALGHAQTLCNMLAQAACPVAFLAGDLALAERFTALLIEQSVRFSLGVWHAYGRCFEGIARIRRGDVDRGLASLRAAGSGLSQGGFIQYHTPYLLGLAEGLADSRATEEGLVTIEQALARTEATGEQWCLPELLRVKGELLRQVGSAEARLQAEQQFLASFECADRHQALSWQLRAAISLAELLREDGRRRDGLSLLSAIHSRFSEGFDTADLKRAARLLAELD
ncbi:MAG TPA: winged helix-turn-helix domain-containing protein [Candidatus Sulfotelmatobacter sp.]|nr:winged helix-turn-helix domain-containing protein [Candidatus Sulfotelmatobacter sp.]